MVDTVVVKSAESVPQEDPAHVEAMVAKVDAAEAAATETSESPQQSSEESRPEWLPEKFKTPEDLAKAYKELESKLGSPEKKTEVETEKAPEEPTQSAAEEELANRGLSFDEFSQEFYENGSLSDASYEKLQEAGIPREVVDQYIAGQQAIAARMESEVKALVGGDEGFQELATWATENISDEELAAYNRAVNSGDIGQAKLAVAGLYQKFQEARPNEPKLLQSSGGRPSADTYESIAQLQEDMSNPKYKTDPAFRKKVQEKLGRSDIL